MGIIEILAFLNGSPYVFWEIGTGVVFKFEIGEIANKICFEISKDRGLGGLKVECRFAVFHFEWDRKNRKWGF